LGSSLIRLASTEAQSIGEDEESPGERRIRGALRNAAVPGTDWWTTVLEPTVAGPIP
jgi:hypothetical protein